MGRQLHGKGVNPVALVPAVPGAQPKVEVRQPTNCTLGPQGSLPDGVAFFGHAAFTHVEADFIFAPELQATYITTAVLRRSGWKPTAAAAGEDKHVGGFPLPRLQRSLRWRVHTCYADGSRVMMSRIVSSMQGN